MNENEQQNIDHADLEKAYDADNMTLSIEGEFGIEEFKLMMFFLLDKLGERIGQ